MVERTASEPLATARRPQISYIICASQRSGSSLLGEALRLTGVAGNPEEYFLVWQRAAREPQRLTREHVTPWLIPPDAYLEKTLESGTTPNGVFGVKIMWDYFDVVIDNIRTIPRCADLRAPLALRAVFPNLRYIYITRRDKTRQAVSLAKAMQSDRWVDLDPAVLERPEYAGYAARIEDQLRPSQRSLSFDFEQIAYLESQIRKQEEGWEAYFAQSAIEPFRVVYEEFADSYEQTALRVLEFLGVPHADVVFQPRLRRRQSDSVNEEWTRRYQEERARRSS